MEWDTRLEYGQYSQRVSASLNSAQVELLDRLAREAKFSGGSKLTHSLILGALVDVLGQIPVDVSGVRSKLELMHRIKEAMGEFGK